MNGLFYKIWTGIRKYIQRGRGETASPVERGEERPSYEDAIEALPGIYGQHTDGDVICRNLLRGGLRSRGHPVGGADCVLTRLEQEGHIRPGVYNLFPVGRIETYVLRERRRAARRRAQE